MPSHLFCFGVGFTALETIRQNPDFIVSGSKRHSDGEPGELAPGIRYLYFDGIDPVSDFDDISNDVTHILVSIPPGPEGDLVVRSMGDKLCDMPNLKWVGYLSTTGVYGNLDGETATEETPYNPSGKRGKRRMDAELEWRKLFETKGLPLHIFRLPGIYGPGRNQLLTVKNGKAHRIVKTGHVFSRIHVEDLGQILTASMKTPNPGSIYNVSDDLAAPPQDVVTYASILLNIAPPLEQEFDTAMMSDMARSFYSDNKHVSNGKIKTELGVSLRYPTYKEGLDALFRTL